MSRYCPHCGEELVLENGALTCLSGNMPLSEQMQKTLEATVAGKVQKSKKTFDGNGMFCFGCGSKTKTNEKWQHVCGCCSSTFGVSTKHRMVEMHPHKKTEKYKYGYENFT